MKRVIVAVICSILMFAACNDGSTKTEVLLENAPYKDATLSVDERVIDLLARMTLEEKLGQMTQVDKRYLKSDTDIETYFLGSILSGGGAVPAVNEPSSWADMYDGYQNHALQTRLGIPIVYGIDAVHGHNNVVGAVVFPHNIGLGATGNPEIVEAASRITAIEVAGTGINWTFSPCITVPQDERWGRTYEGYSENPELVSLLGAASIRGYQGAALNDRESILACAKHFAGDGGTVGGVDRGDVLVDEAIFRSVHIAGYTAALEAGVGSVMISYNSWNGEKMHGHKYLITDVLKGEMGFDGFIVSDWAAINELSGVLEADVEKSINAGIDMIMVPEHYEAFYSALKSLAESGAIPATRIDDAVRRILKVKFDLGLFENSLTDRSLTALIGSDEHRAVARDAVRQSMVLLKNENAALPLSKEAVRIHVAGKAADDIGMQSGGWTISWQGASGDITPGTTIKEAIEELAGANTEVTYSADGTGAEGADVAVVVIGEEPYAEMMGDKQDLRCTAEDIALIESLKAQGMPVVVVLFSGRPMILDGVLENADALVAAWLPGTEGAGVADVLFGDYNPTGKLSFSWPRSMEQIPINFGDEEYDPLFAYGFGLSY